MRVLKTLLNGNACVPIVAPYNDTLALDGLKNFLMFEPALIRSGLEPSESRLLTSAHFGALGN
jgi:hypothetical protein